MTPEELSKLKEAYDKVYSNKKDQVTTSFQRAEKRYLRFKDQLEKLTTQASPEEVLRKVQEVLQAAEREGLQLTFEKNSSYYNYFQFFVSGKYVKDKVCIPVRGWIIATSDGSVQLEVDADNYAGHGGYGRRVFRISLHKRLTIMNEVLQTLLNK
jgi:hypothetical protein